MTRNQSDYGETHRGAKGLRFRYPGRERFLLGLAWLRNLAVAIPPFVMVRDYQIHRFWGVMMRSVSVGIVFFLVLAMSAERAQCKSDVVGRGLSDTAGAGSIDIRIDPTADAVAVANQLKSTLQLSWGARMKVIQAEPGVLHVKFTGASPRVMVEATLPEETRRRLAVLLFTDSSSAVAAASGMPLGVLAAGGVSVAVGGIVGGVIAADDGTKESAPVVSPSN